MKQVHLLNLLIVLQTGLSLGSPEKKKLTTTLDPKSMKKPNSFGSGALISRVPGTRPRLNSNQVQGQPALNVPAGNQGLGQSVRLAVDKIEEEPLELPVNGSVPKIEQSINQVEEGSQKALKANGRGAVISRQTNDKNERQAKVKHHHTGAKDQISSLLSELEQADIDGLTKSLEGKVFREKLTTNIDVSLKKFEREYFSDITDADDLGLDFTFDDIKVPTLFDTEHLFSDSYFNNAPPMIGRNDVLLNVDGGNKRGRKVLVIEVMEGRKCLNKSEREIFRNMLKSTKGLRP
jgi:hypothetical protein